MTLIIDFTDKTSITICNVHIAKTFMRRFFGLMRRKTMGCGAMIFYKCNSIHTFFMRFPIDVLYLDKNLNVVSYVCKLKPWKISASSLGARTVIELPANTITGKPYRVKLENISQN